MRLIVSYSHGDGFTYSCQSDIPVEYESAEQLLVDIEDAVVRYLAAINEHHERRQEFEREHGRVGDIINDSKKRGEWFEKWSVFYEANKTPDERDYQIARLWTSHFIDDGKFIAPNIYTVDEWFAAGERGDLE